MHEALIELRRTVRTLLREPAFTATVTLTLALGLGATTTLFTLVRGVLLSPLPFPEPDRVVRLLGTRLSHEDGYDTVSYPNFDDLRRGARSFTAAAAYDEWQPTLDGLAGGAERLRGASVNADFFAVLGLQPTLGRSFLAAEDVPGTTRAVVLAHGLWRRRFGADRGVVGRNVQLNGTPYEVVGVAPAELEDPGLSDVEFGAPEVWRVSPAYFADGSSRDGFAFTAIARLRPEVSLAAAQAEMDARMAALRERHPEDNADRGVRLVPLHEQLVAPVRPALRALLAATGLLLLVACANTANLLLGRVLARRHELAVRTALGASRVRLVRPLLVEGLTLGALGGGLGLGLAIGGRRAALWLAGDDLPRAGRVELDGGVLLFALAASLLVGTLVALLPAMHGRTEPVLVLQRSGVRVGGDRRARRARAGLVAAEMALSLVLLVAAALMLRTLRATLATDPGLRPRGVLAVQLSPPYPKYDEDAEVLALWELAERRLAALPGVGAVGTVDLLPMGGDYNGMGFTIVGRPAPALGEEPSVETRLVSPGFFAAAGVTIERGRPLRTADGAAKLAIVDHTMAERHFPGEDPVGHRLQVFGVEWEIVGVAASVRQRALAEPPAGTLYVARAAAQPFRGGDGFLLLRTDGDPLALAAAARAALRELDADIPAGEVRPLAATIAATAARSRLQAVLLAAFAGNALLLGAVGIYGVVASNLAARRRELGIRSALGADGWRLLRLALADGLAPLLVGAPLGLLGAWGAAQALAAHLYQVAPLDGWAFAGGALLLALTAIFACWLPARRAARVDPVEALRG